MTEHESRENPYQSPAIRIEKRSEGWPRFMRYAAAALLAVAAIAALHAMVQYEMIQEREWRTSRAELTSIEIFYVRTCHWLFDYGILVDAAITAICFAVAAIPDLLPRNRRGARRRFRRLRSR